MPRLPVGERELFDRAMYRSEPDTLVSRLKADISARRLPAVSWLVPTAALSEHPGASTPVGSANLIYQVLDVLASDRDIWSKTVLLVNFDENDGYFDHVPAPVPPVSAADDWYDGKPSGLGPRVPMTVVSPWTVGGHVCSEVADHTSVLRFLERWTGVAEPNISAWRRTACGDLTSAFDFSGGRRVPVLDQPGPVPAPMSRWRPIPPATQALPGQEPGRRPARALPYRPWVSGFVAQGKLKLRLGNDAPEAAHFAIYPYGGELPAPAHLDVQGEFAQDVPVSGPYELAVQGPNRFWVELAGSVEGVAAGLDVRIRADRGSLKVELENTGTKPLSVKLKARGYGSRTINQDVRGKQTRALTWPTDHGWYDVEVTTAEDPTYRRRLTGHLENGSPSVTG